MDLPAFPDKKMRGNRQKKSDSKLVSEPCRPNLANLSQVADIRPTCQRHAQLSLPLPPPLPLPSPVSILHCCHHCCRCCRHRRHHQCPPLILPSLVGCCVVFCRPLLSLHAVMQPSMLLLPAALAANCCPPPPPPPLPLPLLPYIFGRWCQVYHPILELSSFN